MALAWLPIRFVLVNLPAALPAWVGTYYLSEYLFELFEGTFARGAALVACFAALTLIAWSVINTCYKFAGKMQKKNARKKYKI